MRTVIALAVLLAVFLAYATSLNATSPSNILDNINNIINNYLNIGYNFLLNLQNILLDYIVKISKVVAVIMAMIGAFLYFTRLSRYTGRSLLIGAVLLYIFAEVLKSVA